MADVRYFAVPISMLQGMFANPRSTASDIIEVGIYVRSLSIEGENELARFQAAADFLGVTLGNPQQALHNAKHIYGRIPRGQAVTSINLEIAFDFFTNSKTEFEVACFCSYAGLKSILGSKSHAKITNDYWLARMFGFNSKLDMSNQFKVKTIYKRYSTRHGIDRLKKALEDDWGLKLYGRFMRGYYVSFAMSLESLITAAEKSRKRVKDKEKKDEKQAILNRVLQRLEVELTS